MVCMGGVLLDSYDVAIAGEKSVGTLRVKQDDRDVVRRVCTRSVKIDGYSHYFGEIKSDKYSYEYYIEI